LPRSINSPDQFRIIAENIHTSRSVLRQGRRVTQVDGVDAVEYRGESGTPRYLRVPEHFRQTQAYEQGQIKHMMVAVWKGVHGDEAEQQEGAEYIWHEAKRQIVAGARFLDLNVDEVSPMLDEQIRSMRWLVRTVQHVATVPPSIDSSNVDIIAAGLAEYDGRRGRPLLNSLALERIDALDLVRKYDTQVVATAASVDGMPSGAGDRVENVAKLLERVLSNAVPKGDIYVDALVFPISVSAEYGRHYLDAVERIRREYGPDIQITGGLSNVSFGLPHRRLINESFIRLAIEHGANGGIMDPVSTRVARVFELDVESEPVRIATAMLLGEDEYCTDYLKAYRAGMLGTA
jgi:5-methyltetrahydrofolate--homocysteine methyltransferase